MRWARQWGSTWVTASGCSPPRTPRPGCGSGLRLVRREQQLAATLGVVPPPPEHGFNPN